MNMDETIKRINELAHKQKGEGLNEEEKEEQRLLRQKYIAAIKGNLKAQLDNIRIVDEAFKAGVDTIITCDNGIAAFEQVRHAKEKGMTVVVTDHHEVPFEEGEDGRKKYLLPPADAVVDPKVRDPQTGEMEYPFPEICGAVVAWKLAGMLLEELAPERKEQTLLALLPFCALATVCDVMPLLDENRILVREGLKRAAATSNVGLKSLLIVNGLEGKPLTTHHAGFVIGPCLNATGRLDNAERALALFLEQDASEALRSAQKLRELNDSRKSLTEQGVEQALGRIAEDKLLDKRVLVIYLPECHESLAGIIAGRIRERYCRPVFVLTRTEQGMVKGSGRSIEAYDMFASMTAVKECFTKFGGHKMAAGLSMKEEDIPLLRERLEEGCSLREEDLTEVLHIDMELPPALWTLDMTEELNLLDPCGMANPKPVFAARGIRLHSLRIMGRGQNVLRMEAEDARGARLTLIWFCEADRFQEMVREAVGPGAWDALYAGRADLSVP